MNRNLKLALMFGPLGLLFVLIAVVTADIRQPEIARMNCEVLGTGPAVSAVRRTDNLLYANGSDPLNDIAFQCEGAGIVVVNDNSLFQTEIAAGNPARITRKRYHYLPDRWNIEVRTDGDTTQ